MLNRFSVIRILPKIFKKVNPLVNFFPFFSSIFFSLGRLIFLKRFTILRNRDSNRFSASSADNRRCRSW